MGIDITKHKKHTDEEFLEQLGDDDWLIALPNNYPDLLVSRAWRDDLEKEIGSDFVRWVIAGSNIEMRHDLDIYRDSAAYDESHPVDWLLLLVQYEYLADWLEQARPSKRIFWQSYDKKLDDLIGEMSFNLLRAHVQPLQSHLEEEGMWSEGYDEVDLVDICLQSILEQWVKRISTKEMWRKYERIVRVELAEEAIMLEKLSQAYAKLKDFWTLAFSDISSEKIELPEYRSKGLEQRFQSVFADADPEILEAIVRLGAPLHCSNTVKLAIQSLAEAALE